MKRFWQWLWAPFGRFTESRPLPEEYGIPDRCESCRVIDDTVCDNCQYDTRRVIVNKEALK